MQRSISLGRLARLGSLLVAASLTSAGCAGRSSSQGDNGAANTNDMAAGATGGTSSGSGGSGESSGGTIGAGDATGAGGASGGSANADSSGGTGVGGSTDPGKGGSDSGATGGSGAMPSCANVVCAPIPATCRKIVQPPDECCPTCPDTGCDECEELSCPKNQHLETIPGDCCPSCVADPPDACEQGQKAYAELKAALIDKYGSLGCKNSSECTLVGENTACAASCPIALPTTTAPNFTPNLENAAHACATCPPLTPVLCPAAIAACVNGKCIATGP